jgi:benzodiazapine receptor
MVSNQVRSYILLIVCIAIPLIIGLAGSFATSASIPSWYSTLNKPWFSPPNYIFAPIWTTLYILMGVSLFLVIREMKEIILFHPYILLFAAQLVVNLLWSVIFFGLRSPVLGLITIFILLGLIAATIYSFYQVSKPAAWLLMPYIIWVCIATVLNFMIVILN